MNKDTFGQLSCQLRPATRGMMGLVHMDTHYCPVGAVIFPLQSDFNHFLVNSLSHSDPRESKLYLYPLGV